MEEEQQLVAELRRIEARKKERERKTQDLQKLISGGGEATDSHPTPGPRKYKTHKNKKLNANKLIKSDTQVAWVTNNHVQHKVLNNIFICIRCSKINRSGDETCAGC